MCSQYTNIVVFLIRRFQDSNIARSVARNCSIVWRTAHDVAADDVIGRVVELRGDEAQLIDPVDLEGGDDVGQRRRSVGHPGIMP